MSRYLIVNADDFGRSRGINRGVALAHEGGIVTSASLMVRWPAAAEAASYARANPGLAVGLHLDLSEWVHDAGGWTPVYRVVPDEGAAAVATEIHRQLETFRELMGRGPTHLDSHQHIHRSEPTRGLLEELGRTLGVPVRECTPRITYCGAFYGQTGTGDKVPNAISVEALLALLSALPVGTTELGCHPAAEPEHGSSYATERTEELRVLCDPRVREALEVHGIALRSFADVRTEPAGHESSGAGEGAGR
jgi:predicted glycoside hydrolase/deacetylase ChbG (UPF0249 family)